jgi:hypothetical protein
MVKRVLLLPYISTIYRRWYYSALIEDTPLSPANITEALNDALLQSTHAYPAVRLKNQSKYNGIHIHLLEATRENHPIVNDLRILVEFCSPSIDLSPDDGFWDYQAITLSNLLSLCDPHYASYLLEVSLWMDLIIKLPSIYTNQVQVSKGAAEHLAASNEELFNEIVDISIKMSSVSLNQLIELPEPIFTEAFTREMLKEPVDTDDIFQYVYDTIGFSLDDLFEPDDEGEMDSMDAAFLSGTYMMGILLDKYFFAPFSYYLRLIRPLYVLPFDFEQEMTYFLDSHPCDDEAAVAFFAPCSRYELTRLGKQTFGVKADDATTSNPMLSLKTLEKNLFDRPEVMDSLPIWVNQPAYKYSHDFHEGSAVHSIRIKAEYDTSLWMQLEIPEEYSLHKLYAEVIMRLGLIRNDDYTFFHDDIESPFTEYPCKKRRKRTHKHTDITLKELDFQYKKTLILMAYNQSPLFGVFFAIPNASVKLVMEVTERKPRESGRAYPYLARISRNLRSLCDNDTPF